MPEVFELFPTPVMRVEGLIGADRVGSLLAQMDALIDTANHRSDQLLHTRILSPSDDPTLGELALQIEPHLEAFGELLFGEKLQWAIKEMWLNRMQTGGHQAVHNHANCFVSGVLYLSDSDSSANTVFVRALGGRDYVFNNSHAGTQPGPFNADKWVAPAPAAGDLLLFPSYLLHEVPVNRGGLRSSLSFNAIPHRLDAWGYAVSFSG